MKFKEKKVQSWTVLGRFIIAVVDKRAVEEEEWKTRVLAVN